MDTAVGIATILVGAAAASAAVWLAILTRRQLEVAQKQVEQAIAARQDTYLPLLVPKQFDYYTRLTDDGYGHQRMERGERYNAHDDRVRVGTLAVGPGTALNLRAVFCAPASSRQDTARFNRYASIIWHIPVVPGSEFLLEALPGGFKLSSDAKITSDDRSCDLFPSAGPRTYSEGGYEEEITGRLTYTYHDVFGRKHAAIYDYAQRGIWITVAILSNITADLDDLQREAFS